MILLGCEFGSLMTSIRRGIFGGLEWLIDVSHADFQSANFLY
jgi:hypothetical protein